MTGYQRYRAARLFVWPAALLYALVAFTGRPAGQAELFPFFNWSLFTLGPVERADRVLLIRAIDGRRLAAPTMFYDLPDIFPAARAKDPSLMKLLDRWAIALRSSNRDAAEKIRAVVEDSFMQGARSIDYDLAVIGYDPLRRLRDGSIDHLLILGSFSKGAQ